jgi:putative PIG3 family NAD(P)H quinone oxidoreductase
MRAVVIEGTRGIESLFLREVSEPVAAGDRVLVRVRAAGINRADLMQAMGTYPAPAGAPADVPGLEFAGTVEALGAECAGGLKVGDRVFGIVGGGGLAEKVVVPERMAARVPDRLDWAEAGAVPEAFLTAHDALTERGRARPGERVLIHAVAGGVGLAAAQIAKAMGCVVIGTSRTAAKRERVVGELGIDAAVDPKGADWPDRVLEATGGRGVDVVIDHVGASTWEGNLRCLATLGRVVVVGLLGGSKVSVDLRALMDRRATMVGTVLRARPVEEKIAATRAFAARVVPWLERGIVRPVVDAVYGLDQVREAVGRMASNAGFGRVVVVM